MLTQDEAIAKFITPVTTYNAIGKLQKTLLRSAVTVPPNDTLSATNILALFGKTDIYSLMHTAITKVTLKELTTFQLGQLSELGVILLELQPFEDTIRRALEESRKFLPIQSVNILKEYNSEGYPFERYGVTAFIIMAATLQD